MTKKNGSPGKLLIFDVQRFSIHDGPGIRTTIFMKGCPLQCDWCSNPESQHIAPEIMFDRSRCIKCGGCLKVCPTCATFELEGEIRINREACIACGQCVKVCNGEARQIAGRYMTIEELVEEVKKDELFYRNSGGGVTISGGEPSIQVNATRDLLKRLQENGLHTTLDTCGHANREDLEKILSYVDLVLFDLKHMDSEKHREYTGFSNEVILDNLELIVSKGIPTWVRIAIIPGYNDSEENIKEMARFISWLNSMKPNVIIEVNLLPYHNLGTSKYKSLGREYKLGDTKAPEPELINERKGWVQAEIGKEIRCSIGE